MTSAIFTDGKEYISAVRASKKIGYASDYIGQLCRAKKIPAKLIGKTWYVDYKALVDHKRNRKLGKRKLGALDATLKQEEIQENILEKFPLAFSSPEPEIKLPEIDKPKIVNSLVITYEKDDSPRLPELSKSSLTPLPKAAPRLISKVSTPSKQKVLPKKQLSFSKVLLPVVTALLIFAGAWGINSGSISLAPLGNIYRNISDALSTQQEPALLASALEWLKKIFGIEEEQNVYVAQGPVESPSGIVVIPEPDDREGAIAKIKKVFSDEVEVSFDEQEDTGVITPVFREGDDFENYTFVLVPIEEGGEANN